MNHLPLLNVKKLSVCFDTRNGTVDAVKQVDFKVFKNQITAIVGESGSGKSVSCYSLLGLIPSPPGRIKSGQALFTGDNSQTQDLLSLNKKELHQLRGNDIAMIFQDPMTCLNPFLKIGEQLIEPLIYHKNYNRKQALKRALNAIKEVGITEPEQRLNAYPHELSGGMRQRIMIAMALITEPKLLIADEPTTALDVTIQAQILKLIKQLQASHNIGVIFISHDLAVVADIADHVVVMQAGSVVESKPAKLLFKQPEHPYTQKLLNSVPQGGKQNPVHSDKTFIQIHNLKTYFSKPQSKQIIKAVNDVSFDINKGEILGLVGESGSGKSTIGRSILRLITPTSGKILFKQQNLTELKQKQLKPLRQQMQMIFQDPYASLNPRMTIYDTLAEPLLTHKIVDKTHINKEVNRLLNTVGLTQSASRKYPHEFSGGQRQRVAIGRAIACKPDFIVADEPVSALDVTIQSQILELIEHLVSENQLTMLFISHDLSVVRRLCDRVLVLHHGQLVESGETEKIFKQPNQTYTSQLVSAIALLPST